MGANEGNNFTSRIKKIFDNDQLYVTKENLKKIGKNRIVDENGNDLGDIDVFVIDKGRKEILLIECKSMLVARTPYELYLELTKVFNAPNSQLVKHLRRYNWGKKNLDLILSTFKLNKDHWKIKALFVSQNPLFSPFIYSKKNITFFTYEDLKELYQR
jgi:hypothetical protein